MGTSHRQKPVKQVVGARPRRACASCSRCPTATRSRSATAAPPRSGTPPRFGLVRERALHLTLRRVLLEVRHGHARARRSSTTRSSSTPTRATRPLPIADPTCDVVAWAHNETSTGVMVAGRSRVGDGARARSTPPRAPAACPSTSSEADVYYFAPQKCFAADGGLWLALLSPAAQRAHRARSPRRRPLDPRVPVARDRARQLAQGPDLQHARARDAAPARRPARVDERQRRPGLVRAAHHRVLARSSTAGPRRRAFADAVRRRPGQALARRRHDRLRRRRRRRRGRRDAARQRHRRHRALPQARPQPAAHRHVPGDRARRRRGAHRVHRLRRGGSWHDARSSSPRRSAPPASTCCASTSTSTRRSTRTASTSSSASATTTAS